MARVPRDQRPLDYTTLNTKTRNHTDGRKTIGTAGGALGSAAERRGGSLHVHDCRKHICIPKSFSMMQTFMLHSDFFPSSSLLFSFGHMLNPAPPPPFPSPPYAASGRVKTPVHLAPDSSMTMYSHWIFPSITFDICRSHPHTFNDEKSRSSAGNHDDSIRWDSNPPSPLKLEAAVIGVPI